MMKKTIQVLITVMLLNFFLPTLPSVTATEDDGISSDPIETAMYQLASNDPVIEAAWSDYLHIVNTYDYWDQIRWSEENLGTDKATIVAEFTPDANLVEEESQLIYQYDAPSLASLELRLIFTNDELYYSELVAIPEIFTEEMVLSSEAVAPVIANDFPDISVLLDQEPPIIGVASMVRDGLLGTGVLFLAGDSLDTANLELMLYIDTVADNSVYFPPQVFAAYQTDGFDDLKADLNFYMRREFTMSAVLSELVNRNTTFNQGFRNAQNNAEIILNDFTLRNLEDSSIEGGSLETVTSSFEGEATPEYANPQSNTDRIVYTYVGSDDSNQGQLTLMFVDNQLAFVSTQDNSINPLNPETLTASLPLAESDIQLDQPITPLMTKAFDVYAVATMSITNGNHNAIVVPLEKPDGIRLAILDSKYQTITAITYLDELPEAITLDEYLFRHILNQYLE
ncbi:hypothetical protein ACTQ54_07010 [Fundicoccus sp. Sow4_H7]|uniref:hypothetical protein n=1 Tax=Fundicoccus sp. Sow4_H7 TaxID=3438784 RepID=UPI003F8EB24B